LIDICYQKYNKKISDSWDYLAKTWNYTSGEALRSKFKKYRKANGILKAKDIINSVIIGNGDRELITPAPAPINNYKESVEIKSDNSQISDKLLEMSLAESKDVDFVLKSHGYDCNLFELVSAKNSMWNMNTKADGIKTLYASKIAVKPKTEYQWNEADAKKIFTKLKTYTRNKSSIKPL